MAQTIPLKDALSADIGLTHHATSGRLSTPARIDYLPLGVFATLDAVASTTITEGGTFQQLVGTFTNSPLQGFSTGTGNIAYTATEDCWFEIVWNAAVKCDAAGKNIHIGVALNDEVIATTDGGVMGGFAKYADEIIHLSGTRVLSLSENDELQIQVTSTTTGDTITCNHFTTAIRRFFS